MTTTFQEAVAAQQAGDFATAERGYLALPGSRNALYNLATVYRRTGRLAEAEEAYRRILAQYPDLAGARRSLAMCLLAQRRYAEAWPLYEARRQVQATADPAVSYPEWRGEPLAGKRLMVVVEQGFGDQLMFSRYLQVAQAQGAQVCVACDPRSMARLFERLGLATTPHLRPGQPLPAADYWVFMCSLPLRLGHPEPPPPVFIEAPREGRGVGVAPRGNPRHGNDRNRSLDDASATRLLRLGRDLSPAATGAVDFLDTAEIVAGLERIVAVDTSIVHLAGAMGKPCWVLLPAVGLDWRWNDGVRSDWYPDARLLRQSAAGDWSGVLTDVEADLGRGGPPPI